MSQGIYQIINRVNGNSYVGQSIQIEERWKQHINSSKNKKSKNYNYWIYRAIRKYGIESFDFRILEIIGERKKLTEKEQYWYDIIKPEYNMERPKNAERKRQSVAVLKIDINTGNILEHYPSMRSASRLNNVTKVAIANVCNGIRNSANGYYWVREKDYQKGVKPPKDKGNNGSRRTEISVINKNTLMEEMIFESRGECARYFGVTPSSISWRCQTKDFKSDINGFYFRYRKEWKNETN